MQRKRVHVAIAAAMSVQSRKRSQQRTLFFSVLALRMRLYWKHVQSHMTNMQLCNVTHHFSARC